MDPQERPVFFLGASAAICYSACLFKILQTPKELSREVNILYTYLIPNLAALEEKNDLCSVYPMEIELFSFIISRTSPWYHVV